MKENKNVLKKIVSWIIAFFAGCVTVCTVLLRGRSADRSGVSAIDERIEAGKRAADNIRGRIENSEKAIDSAKKSVHSIREILQRAKERGDS